MNTDALIAEMQQVKQQYPTLEISEVLRIFNIQALQDLTREINNARINR